MKKNNKNLFPYKDNNKRYHTIDYFYKQKFRSKIVKISLNAGFTCPNIDGKVGTGGCIYCSNLGSGEFAGNPKDDLKKQFEEQTKLMNQKWPNSKYIGYFQAHTNTYAPLSVLKEKYETVLSFDNVIGLAIATRPDSISEECLDYLEELSKKTFLTIELGLQTIHEKTAHFINRCHSLDCFVKTVSNLRKRNINVVVHIMNGLPYETKEMMIETARFLNTLDIQGIKIHMLHILKHTKLARLYQEKPFPILTKKEYIDIVIVQLEEIKPSIVIHRITGDPKKEDLITPQWLLNKMDVLNGIDKELERRNTYQGFLLDEFHFSEKVLQEHIKYNTSVYSFDKSSKIISFLKQITNHIIYTLDGTYYIGVIYYNLTNSLTEKQIKDICSHLHKNGIFIMECNNQNPLYEKLGIVEQYQNHYFYKIKKN